MLYEKMGEKCSMIRLREMPVAVYFNKTDQSSETKKVFYNFGIGHSTFILKCNVQHRGAARVKVEYGTVLLGEFGWHSGIAYIVGEVTTANPNAYPAFIVTVTVEAFLSKNEHLLSVDFWLVCDEPTPAPHPYNVARNSGTALPDIAVFPTTNFPSNITSQPPITSWTRTTSDPSVITTTTTPVPITLIPTYPPTTTAPTEPTLPPTFPVTTSVVPTTYPITTSQPPIVTYPVDPTTDPLSVVKIKEGINDLYNNKVYSLEDANLLFAYKILGGHGIYEPSYHGLFPPLIVRSYSSETNLEKLDLSRRDDLTLSQDVIKSIDIGNEENNYFAKNQAGDHLLSFDISDTVSSVTVSDIPIHVIDSSDTFIDPAKNENHDIIISAFSMTDFIHDSTTSTSPELFMTDLFCMDMLKYAWFPTTTWYMAFKNLKHNAMLMRVSADVEPLSIKNWHFTFTPATSLKNKSSFYPYSLQISDFVYLDDQASKWFSMDKCIVIPRFKMINKYTYWLFIFPDMLAVRHLNYDLEPDQSNIVWSKMTSEYQFYNGGPFTFSKYTDSATNVNKPSPIFYAGTFKADIKNDDGSLVLKTTRSIDFWYSCGDTLSSPVGTDRINGLKINLELS